MRHRLGGTVTWGAGPIGDAVRASLDGRLRRFIRDEESEPVALFSPQARTVSDAGEWYGEHLGKWLMAAGHAHRRTGDAELGASIRRVVDYVVAQQEADGYLGTYAPGAACRFTDPRAEDVRTWDLWVHAYLVLGMLRVSEPRSFAMALGQDNGARGGEREVADAIPSPGVPPAGRDESPSTSAIPELRQGEPSPEARRTAIRVGELILSAFADRSPLDQGNHAGLSSGVVVEPLARLTLATGDDRFAALALRTVDEMESRLGLLSKPDVAEIGTGKAYQILWNLVGLVALHEATGQARLLEAAERLWQNVRDHHLTPLGGPWGGLQGHKETFAPKGAFSPHGMVETCSAATWMALCRDLFALTGDPKYVMEFERTLMNALLGALEENGRDWVYFGFPNGRRNDTYHWACCRSSGAMALEEASDMVASATDDAIWLHLLLPCRVEIEGCAVEVAGQGDDVTIRYDGERPLRVRIPEWSGGESLYAVVASDRPTTFRLDPPLRVVPYTHVVDHHGQEIVRMDYAYLQRGPYVYATGLIDGYKKEETLRLPRLTPEAPFRTRGESVDLHQPGREPIEFVPYYRAGGRHDGAWRTTWLQIAWQ